MPWLPTDEFRECFASANLVVFPSDFEGFGLPAIEAMRLGKPVVISPEPALVEVTGGHAVVTAGPDAGALARAVVDARSRSTRQLAAARAHTDRYTWDRAALAMRTMLVEAGERRRSPAALRG